MASHATKARPARAQPGAAPSITASREVGAVRHPSEAASVQQCLAQLPAAAPYFSPHVLPPDGSVRPLLPLKVNFSDHLRELSFVLSHFCSGPQLLGVPRERFGVLVFPRKNIRCCGSTGAVPAVLWVPALLPGGHKTCRAQQFAAAAAAQKTISCSGAPSPEEHCHLFA